MGIEDQADQSERYWHWQEKESPHEKKENENPLD
jgi:hypothetical protein